MCNLDGAFVCLQTGWYPLPTLTVSSTLLPPIVSLWTSERVLSPVIACTLIGSSKQPVPSCVCASFGVSWSMFRTQLHSFTKPSMRQSLCHVSLQVVSLEWSSRWVKRRHCLGYPPTTGCSLRSSRMLSCSSCSPGNGAQTSYSSFKRRCNRGFKKQSIVDEI